MLFNKVATSIISGSLAAFSIIVRPSALTAASIVLMVAPTETISIKIVAAFRRTPSVVKCMAFSLKVIRAPKASNALMCKSIGLGPRSQPPGNPTVASPNLPSKEPLK